MNTEIKLTEAERETLRTAQGDIFAGLVAAVEVILTDRLAAVHQ